VAKQDEFIVAQGVVDEVLPNATFRVTLTESQHTIIAYLGGKLRKNNIKVLMGDLVEIEMSPYDLSKGRVTYRNK
jgi:translation initiation factor IF-1